MPESETRGEMSAWRICGCVHQRRIANLLGTPRTRGMNWFIWALLSAFFAPHSRRQTKCCDRECAGADLSPRATDSASLGRRAAHLQRCNGQWTLPKLPLFWQKPQRPRRQASSNCTRRVTSSMARMPIHSGLANSWSNARALFVW